MSTHGSTSTVPGLLGDRDPDARAGHRHQAGQDAERVGLLLGLLERRLPRAGARTAGRRGCARAGRSRTRARWRGAGEAVEDVDQVLLAQAGVGVVDVVGAHLGDRGEAEQRPAAPRRRPGRGSGAAARRRSRPRPARRSGRCSAGVASLGVRLGVGRASASGQAWKRCRPDRGDVGEDPDPEDDDDAGRELAADAELVAEEDDAGRDHHVADERDDEDLVVEDAVEVGAQAAEDGVEGGDDGDRQVGLEAERVRRAGRSARARCRPAARVRRSRRGLLLLAGSAVCSASSLPAYAQRRLRRPRGRQGSELVDIAPSSTGKPSCLGQRVLELQPGRCCRAGRPAGCRGRRSPRRRTAATSGDAVDVDRGAGVADGA